MFVFSTAQIQIFSVCAESRGEKQLKKKVLVHRRAQHKKVKEHKADAVRFGELAIRELHQISLHLIPSLPSDSCGLNHHL